MPLAAVALLAAACGDSGTEDGASSPTGAEDPAGEIREGGTLVYGSSAEVASMDPVRLGYGRTGEDRGMQVYDLLLTLDENGEVQPRIAESMESDDGRVWTMKLRDGVRFTDGTPFDAEAVIFNVERQLDPENRFSAIGTVEAIESMRAVDDLTVEFTLSAPSGTFPIAFTSLAGFIASPTALQADPEGFGQAPVGAGAFTVSEWVRDSHMVLARNPDYWQEDRPYLEEIRLQVIPDPVTRDQAFEAGQLDIEAVEEILSASPAVVEALQGASGGAIVVPNNSRAPGDDIRVREALQLAFDPAATNQALLRGAWVEEELVCPPFSSRSPICVEWFPAPDQDRARELIAEYVGDGGSPQVDFLTNVGLASTEYIQQVLTSIGLEVTLRELPSSEYLPAVNAGDFQLAWSGHSSFSSPFPRIFQWFYSGARNMPKHDLPELDDALLQARDALTPEERTEGWREFQRILGEEHLVAYYAPYFAGYVKGDDVSFGDQPGGETANQLFFSEVGFTR